MKALGYWEKDGTRHAWFGGPVPEGAVIVKDAMIPGPLPGPDPRDVKIADLEAALTAMDVRLKELETKSG